MNTTNPSTAPESVLERGEAIQAAQIQAAIASAAIGLVQAGIGEGGMRLPVTDALKAAATVYQVVYGRAAMQSLMQQAAKVAGVADAYREIAARPRS